VVPAPEPSNKDSKSGDKDSTKWPKFAAQLAQDAAVGRCRLNEVDPYPITYNLSNHNL
jgi:hypothetical protein